LLKHRPLYDRVLVRRDDPELKSSGGLHIPTMHAEKQQFATVVAVGEGRINPEGKIIPLRVKEGDRVLLGKYSGTIIQDPDNPSDNLTLMIREEEILGWVDETPDH